MWQIGILLGEQPILELLPITHLAVELDKVEAKVAEKSDRHIGKDMEPLVSFVIRQDHDRDA